MYLKISLVNFGISFLFIPIYGYYTDRLASGHELMLSFGIRCVASFACFTLDSPHGGIVTVTFVAISLSATIQGVVIDSMFSKRLPGDIRASLLSVKALVSNVGHLVFVGISLISIDYFQEINESMIFVGCFDATVFIIVMLTIILGGYEKDKFFGKEAREQGE